jgi:nucleoside-diphosphate-sugar epimerase
MTVLIIGTGLVGSQIARILVEQGERPVLMDRAPQPKALGEIVELTKVTLTEGDVLQPLALAAVLRDYAVSEVVHMAANPMLTIGAQKNPVGSIELNVMGTANVLEAARVFKLKRVVVASSNVLNHHIEGGEGRGDPMDEEAFPRPLSIYASCKQAIESIGLNYARWFGVDFAAVRYGAVAGPWSGAGGGGPSNVFLTLIRNAMRGEEGVVPAATLEWVYSKDAAAATVAALQAGALKSRVFNITMGKLTSPEDLVAAVKAVLPQAKLRIARAADGTPALANMTRACSLRRAREELGYAPRYPMAAAVRDLVEWLETVAAAVKDPWTEMSKK